MIRRALVDLVFACQSFTKNEGWLNMDENWIKRSEAKIIELARAAVAEADSADSAIRANKEAK